MGWWGGFVGLLNFISAAMSSTTTRFINYEMGKVDGKPRKIFNVCLIIHVGFALVFLLLAESIGLYYILNYLNVDAGKEADAMFVYQISIMVASVGVINIPYSSLLFAYEKFGMVAIIDIVNVLVKFFLVISLLFYSGNSLRLYALGMSLITLSSFITYYYIAYKNWPEVISFKWYGAKNEFKKILFFNNYNILSVVAIICRSQGCNMLINYFFGTMVNGAFSVAYSVQQYVLTLTDNIDRAASPQIIQNVSKGNFERSNLLVYRMGKFSVLIIELVYFPVSLEIDFLLRLWLGNVPNGASVFCQYTLIIAFLAATAAGMGQVINACGTIKWFKIQMSFLYIAVLPLGFILFKRGFPPYSILILFILSDFFNRVNQLYLLKKINHFDSWRFVKEAYWAPLKVLIVMLFVSFFYKSLLLQSAWAHLLGIFVLFIITFLIIYIVGLDRSEKEKIVIVIKKIVRFASIS